MDKLIPILFYILTGICFQSGITTLLSRPNKKIYTVKILFSLVCIMVGIASVTNALFIQADNIADYIQYYRISLLALISTFIILPVLTSAYRNRISRIYLYVVSILVFALIAYNYLSYFGLSYGAKNALEIYTLPWGENIHYLIAQQGMLAKYTLSIVALIILMSIYELSRVYITRKKANDLYMILGIGGLFSYIFVVMLIDIYYVRYNAWTVFGYIPLILAFNRVIDISGKNEKSVVESDIKYKQILDQAPVGIALYKYNKFLEANQAFLKFHGIENIGEFDSTPSLRNISHTLLNQLRANPNQSKQGYTKKIVGLKNNGDKFPALITVKTINYENDVLFIIFMHNVNYSKTQQTVTRSNPDIANKEPIKNINKDIKTDVKNNSHKDKSWDELIKNMKGSENAIKYLSEYDQLTNLSNKKRLLQYILNNIDTENESWNVLFIIDLNDFSELNNTKGHSVGDMLLKIVARNIQKMTRASDLTARIIGDEYAILFSHLADEYEKIVEMAHKRAREYLYSLNRAFNLRSYNYHNSARIGIIIYKSTHKNIASIISKAELAMYKAKQDREHIVIYNQNIHGIENVRIYIESELRKAIQNNNLKLIYQPLFDNKKHIVSLEALIRLDDNKYKYNSPFFFLSVAEETGLIVQFNKWVLKNACTQLKNWQSDPVMKNMPVSVNISHTEFKQKDFVNIVKSQLSNQNIDISKIVFELNESIFLDPIEEVFERMMALQKIGVKLSIDNFGAAFTSLEYFHELPIIQIKIDSGCIKNIATNRGDQIIVSLIIAMANSLNITVIAKGVETLEQVNMLKSLGCSYFQGYLFCKPENPELIRQSIISHRYH